MLNTVANVFRIPELRKKIFFTLFLLLVYRLGFAVPLPGIDQGGMRAAVGQQSTDSSGFGQLAAAFALFTGGDLMQSTVFGLGIMPYISASIIFQLLATVVPAIEKLQKEGESGRKKINEYTRYATVGLCLVQATMWTNYMHASGYVYPDFAGTPGFWLMAIAGLTTGTVFLMWLGEQIDEYGIGNGISLIIMAGIVARMPNAVIQVVQTADFDMASGQPGMMTPPKILFILMAFVGVVAGSILITQAQRRIPIQQAKHTRGRRVLGGQRQYLPLRVNHGGVMPIIFASSLMIFPGIMMGWISGMFITIPFLRRLWIWLQPGQYMYTIFYIALVYFFAYFWTAVQFQPKEMANNLRDYGSFIPGLRPGKRTADYLERVMGRITYVGASFLAMIAVIPTVVAMWLKIPFMVSSFLGGTGLLIVVSVALDVVQRIEANLVMRNYKGFLSTE